jgi:uncharacterized protein
MEKKYFTLYLLPSRPDFAFTMTDEEKAIMHQHVSYWMDKMNKGQVVAFGPVMDPKGPYGLGIVSAENEEEIKDFIDKDPASRLNKYEYFPMQAIVANQNV